MSRSFGFKVVEVSRAFSEIFALYYLNVKVVSPVAWSQCQGH